jgi:hypothetical protein
MVIAAFAWWRRMPCYRTGLTRFVAQAKPGEPFNFDHVNLDQ